jgi:hypothetical protein
MRGFAYFNATVAFESYLRVGCSLKSTPRHNGDDALLRIARRNGVAVQQDDPLSADRKITRPGL